MDHADWNYRPLLSAISRTRFRFAVKLLAAERRPSRLLEIGYGSGVFMPELARHCEELYAIDIHGMNEIVGQSLADYGVTAHLFSGSATALPFENEFFERVVAVSSLEFVTDLSAACTEIKRVLKPEGSLIVVTPGHSPIVDLGLKVLTGESAKKDYGERRESLMRTLLNHFEIERRLIAPALGSSVVHLYTAMKLRARERAAAPAPRDFHPIAFPSS